MGAVSSARSSVTTRRFTPTPSWMTSTRIWWRTEPLTRSSQFNKGAIVRQVEFNYPVKQIMSCRHHDGDAEADDIYIMLWSGIVYKVNGSKLADESVDNSALGMVEVAKSGSAEGSDDEDEDDRGEFRGFSVFNNKICVYGNDGLFTADVPK